MDFEAIWANIVSNAGQEFRTKKELPYTYQVVNGAVVPDRTGFALARINFEKAAKVEDLTGPGKLGKDVMGPSYVYGILSDPRIR